MQGILAGDSGRGAEKIGHGTALEPLTVQSDMKETITAKPGISHRRLWRGLLIAPVVAPVSFVLLLFVTTKIAHCFGAHTNGAVLIFLLFAALAGGFPMAYCCAVFPPYPYVSFMS